jgi:Holliday junction resolvase-like predicted endonuclease
VRQRRLTGQEPCRFDVVAIEAGELFWHRQVFD